MANKKILITGSAGFIGFHLVNKLVKENYNIIGLDNINDYYDVKLKYSRLRETGIPKNKITNSQSLISSNRFKNYKFIKLDLLDKNGLMKLFKKERFDYIIHLAAQAGVRYSLKNPQVYIDSNIIGFFNLLESCRNYTPKHIIFASSSSVYGNNSIVPFSEEDNTDYPVSLYAATKKSNEVMAYVYSHLYNIPMTGLRFFTVYGPWGRPDMAYYSFVRNIIEGKPIIVYNYGNLFRDFTYIKDAIEVIDILFTNIVNKNYLLNYNIYNIGNDNPTKLLKFIKMIEKI